jgi:hypothetical protein
MPIREPWYDFSTYSLSGQTDTLLKSSKHFIIMKKLAIVALGLALMMACAAPQQGQPPQPPPPGAQPPPPPPHP